LSQNSKIEHLVQLLTVVSKSLWAY